MAVATGEMLDEAASGRWRIRSAVSRLANPWGLLWRSLAILLPLWLVAATAAALVITAEHEASSRLVRTSMLQGVKLAALQVEQKIADGFANAALLADLWTISGASKPAMQAIATAFFRQDAAYDGITVFAADTWHFSRNSATAVPLTMPRPQSTVPSVTLGADGGLIFEASFGRAPQTVSIALSRVAGSLLTELAIQHSVDGRRLSVLDETGQALPGEAADAMALDGDLLQQVLGSREGTASGELGHYAFVRLAGKDIPRWTIVARLPKAEERALFAQRDTLLHWVNLGVLALLAVVSATAGYQWHHRTQAHRMVERLNRQLAQDNQSLTAVNQELEAFSYSVSHDLRTPLRSIDGFSQALLEDYSDKLDEDGRDYLERVRKAAQRMGHLIDDMIVLARVSRTNVTRKPVDLSRIARESARHLAEVTPDREIRWEIEPLVRGTGDPDLIRVVLDNLIGNAVKFTAHTPEARVSFGYAEQNGQQSFAVSDNGAGFDMAYASKLFGAFQRLHDAQEFPGSGIGLATVQRIIHKHGGRIWAQSEPGKGATFYFTLGPET